MKVADRVIVRDAHNQLLKATVDPVPRTWRDGLHGEAWTTWGDFPKCWVRFEDSGHVVPWPLSDVFTDLKAARGAQGSGVDITITPLGAQLSPRARKRVEAT